MLKPIKRLREGTNCGVVYFFKVLIFKNLTSLVAPGPKISSEKSMRFSVTICFMGLFPAALQHRFRHFYRVFFLQGRYPFIF